MKEKIDVNTKNMKKSVTDPKLEHRECEFISIFCLSFQEQHIIESGTTIQRTFVPPPGRTVFFFGVRTIKFFTLTLLALGGGYKPQIKIGGILKKNTSMQSLYQ